MNNEAENEAEKQCRKCHTVKPLDCFHKSGRGRVLDERTTICKPCQADRSKEYRLKVKDTEKYKLQQAAGQRAYYARNTEKSRAHNLAKRVQVKDRCEYCGATGVLLHKHHPDYSKPREVITLCVACHERIHHAAA